MYALHCELSARPEPRLWDTISGLLYQFHSQGIDEGEERAPEGEKALVAGCEFEQAIEPGVLAPPQKFIAYFDNRRDAEKACRAIEGLLEPLSPSFRIEEVAEKDYSEIWKENFQPIHSQPNWLIRASWHRPGQDYALRNGELELIIEPGMAFGTGSHETTRSCLELMTEACQAIKPKRVLDFGCGSGILAIGLKKLGVADVLAVDIDPLAVDSTHQNAERNGVSVTALLDMPKVNGLDGIVANILKNTLLDFAEPFSQWVRPGGFLILSGLLSDQEETIVGRYKTLGFQLERTILANNWVSLRLTKL